MKYLLDASAVLALVLDEPGQDAVREVLDGCSIHAVNVAEVVKKLMQKGVPFEDAVASVAELHLEVDESFSQRDAGTCGRLLVDTMKHGLGLGDCVCLTAAARQGSVAVTAERRWASLDGVVLLNGDTVRVKLIR